jgi:hypothetical protein
MIMLRSTVAILAPASTSSCATPAAKQAPMSYEACAAATLCTVEGRVTVKFIDHVRMAELDLGDGKCISVSLPETEIQRLQRLGPVVRRYTGEVNPSGSLPWDGDFVTLETHGRRVGLSSPCGDFYLFVSSLAAD